MAEIFNIDYKKSNGTLDITFSGQLNINTINKITESVSSNLGKEQAIKLTVKDVDTIDLTFIQLLYSIKNSGTKKGCNVTLLMTLNEEIKSLIINAGFYNLLSSNNQ